MLKTGNHQKYVIALIMYAAILAGCATVGDQKVDVLYKSLMIAKGGSGDLNLVEEIAPISDGSNSIQWILGGIKNKDGEKLGNIITDKAPADLLTDAFIQELKGAGYNIVQEGSMPSEAAKGLKLRSVTITLDEVKGSLQDDAKCIVKISVEPWRNGKATGQLEYAAEYADSAVTDRKELLSKTMLKAIQSIMDKAAPEITKILEKNDDVNK
jgi:hypothetical protein